MDKWQFTVPFVCGATNLGEALRRIAEGAAMIRTKGEAGTGDIVNAETHMRSVFGSIRALQSARDDELYAAAKEHRAPHELVRWVAENGRLPVVTFTAGGIATPADASLCMQLGADGVFVGSGIFKSGRDPLIEHEGWVEDVAGAHARSSRRRRTSRTRRCSPRSRPASDSRWWGSPRARSRRRSGSRCGAGRRLTAEVPESSSNPTFALGESPLMVGVLALQGAFREHARALRILGAEVVEVRKPEDLDGLDGLVIPGGESTTIVQLAELYGLDEAIRSFRGAIFGTCAGMIVLDREHLGLADLEVERNAYGRQVRSFEADVDLAGDELPLHGVFIRAPRIRALGPSVEVARRARRGAGPRPRRPSPACDLPSGAHRRSARARPFPRPRALPA